MAFFDLKRLGTCVGLVILAGCGGSQTPIGTTGAIPQARLTAADGHGRSWVLPEAKNHDLIYYSTPIYPTTYMFSYQGRFVGNVSGGGELCSDKSGNVWIAGYPNGFNNELAEFAHGGTSPIRTLDVAERADNCAVDPTTGNLAAVLQNRYGSRLQIDLYDFSSGSHPRIFIEKKFYPIDLTYDSSGNLFVVGGDDSGLKLDVAELAKGARRFAMLRGFDNKGLNASSGIRWDGKHLTIGSSVFQGRGIYRYVVRGNRLKYVGELDLENLEAIAHYWIQGSKVVATDDGGTGMYAPLYVFNYPAGGYAIRTIAQWLGPQTGGSVTISVAPQ